MTSEVVLQTTKQLRKVFDEDFLACCLTNERAEEWQATRTQLEGEDSANCCILGSLVDRIICGTSQDVEMYVSRVFDLPFGLKSNLVRIIMEQCTNAKVSVVSAPEEKHNRPQGSLVSVLLREWKEGSLTPEQLFCRINTLVAGGEIGLREAQRVTNLILQEAGYDCMQWNPLEGRSQIKSSVCSLLEVDRMFCDAHSAHLFSAAGSFVQLQPAQLRRSDIFYTTGRCMSSTAQLWWEHVGDSDRLEFCAEGGVAPGPGPKGGCFSQLTCRPTLLIGDYVHMQEMCIEVSQVIAVDALSAEPAASILHFCILLQGAILPGRSGFGASYVETDPYRDGETEQNSPHHRAHGSNSSANSEDEENQHSQPPQETHRQYVLLFVAVLDEIPAVMCACALHELVLHDQIPTSVRYLASGLALVSGSNGLLGLVKSGAGVAESLPKHTESAKSPHNTEPKVHLGGPRSTYTTYSLVEDSLLPELPPGFVHSHSGDASITSVDAVRAECASVGQITLVSGDSQGAVCLWHIDLVAGCGHLVCPRYQVDSDPRRVVSLHLSPSGAHVAVGLLDRLVLLNTANTSSTSSFSSSSSSAQVSGLHVRACLDVLCGTQALYGVFFYTDCLRVWRVVNEVRSPSAPGVSYKSELDSFADHEVEANTQRAAEPDSAVQSGLTTRAQSRAQSVGEDLSTFSLDPELVGDGVFPSYAMDGEDISPQDGYSPRVGGSRSVRSPLNGKAGAGVVPIAHLPGISVTTWLHLNVDSFDARHGSTISELEAQLSPPRAKAHHHKAPSDHRDRSQLGIASTWQEVPTVDSCVSPSGAVSPTAPPILQRDDSANSASSGNVSSYTADGTALRDVHSQTSGGSEAMAAEVSGLQLGTHSSLSITDSTATEDEEEEGSGESMQYVQLGDEFMPLYAPLMSSLVPVLPPPAPPSHLVGESAALGAVPPALITDPVRESRAVSGYQVYITEGVTNFRRVIQIHGLGTPSLVPPDAHTHAAGGGADERGLDTSIVMDHRARHSSHFSLYGMHRPFRSFKRRAVPDLDSTKRMIMWFKHDSSEKFLRAKLVLAVICACYQPPTIGIIAAALERPLVEVTAVLHADLQELLSIGAEDKKSLVTVRPEMKGLFKWLCSEDYGRVGTLFWIDPALGHNILCCLYLRYCGNKSVAVEHAWQDYLRTYGPTHLRHASRGLRLLTCNIRKIDETANIRVHLPRQIGYIVGLYEIYARRVGLRGRIPAELGQLKNLRVLSMGNNHLCGELPASLGGLRNLQRIVLHQNNLRGPVPPALGELGCIVNLAGNPLLHHGDDVPAHERQALVELYNSTRGITWSTKNYWCTAQPVAKWYKVGVLTSHVHSIVMSSNGMEGRIPSSIAQLTYLRMIELATMPGLVGTLPRELCSLTTLRRLCICRCGLTGRIPSEIGRLVGLEELQLFGNQLSGSVPASISCLTNLKLLSLGEYTGGNNFTSEPLPQCLAALVHLEALFMANCNIKGQLPDWLGNLTELRQLDLQRNQLCGTVPGSIGRLQNLLYLNIKDNQNLSGRLPLTQLLSLSKLNRLSLVHCNFVDTDYAIEALKAHLPRCKVWI